MQNLKDYFPMLKKATTKNNIPFYGSLIKFSEGKVETCNNLIHTSVNFNTPLRGCVNFFAFEKIFKSLSDKVTIEQTDNSINILDGNTKYKLEIDDVDFPKINLENRNVVEIDNELYYKLKLAKLYTAQKDEIQSHSYIYLSNNEIIATDNSKAFYTTANIDIDIPIPISKEALALANIGDKIGVVITNGENNFILISNNAQMVFSGRADVRNTFPATPIRDFINSSKNNFVKICNILPIRNAIQQVSSVLINEKDANIEINISNKKVYISANSAVIGEAKTEIEGETDEVVVLSVSPMLLNNVPDTFDLYIDKSDTNRKLILIDGKTYILVACD